ncbi:MAG: hypothetical protein ABI613_11385 [Gemmatimonadota bacterium]
MAFLAMVEPWSLVQRCSTSDLLRVLSPGMITGIYHGSEWVEWQDEHSSELDLVATSRLDRNAEFSSARFCCLVETGPSPSPATLGADLLYLLTNTRGVGLVSARAGFLLRWCQRLLFLPPQVRERTPGPYRLRNSSPRLMPGAGSLRLVDRGEVEQSARLMLRVRNPHAVASILGPGFPDLQVDKCGVQIPLNDHHPEEILGLLRSEGIKVTHSAVWYAVLQSGAGVS